MNIGFLVNPLGWSGLLTKKTKMSIKIVSSTTHLFFIVNLTTFFATLKKMFLSLPSFDFKDYDYSDPMRPNGPHITFATVHYYVNREKNPTLYNKINQYVVSCYKTIEKDITQTFRTCRFEKSGFEVLNHQFFAVVLKSNPSLTVCLQRFASALIMNASKYGFTIEQVESYQTQKKYKVMMLKKVLLLKEGKHVIAAFPYLLEEDSIHVTILRKKNDSSFVDFTPSDVIQLKGICSRIPIGEIKSTGEVNYTNLTELVYSTSGSSLPSSSFTSAPIMPLVGSSSGSDSQVHQSFSGSQSHGTMVPASSSLSVPTFEFFKIMMKDRYGNLPPYYAPLPISSLCELMKLLDISGEIVETSKNGNPGVSIKNVDISRMPHDLQQMITREVSSGVFLKRITIGGYVFSAKHSRQ